MSGDIFTALGAGLSLAIAYNPLVAVFVVPVAAGLAGVRGASRERRVWAVTLVGVGWLVGDGLRVLGRARDLYDFGAAGALGAAGAGTAAWPQWLALAVWGVGGLFLGYVLPVWVGAFVGRRVTHGTGWVAAASLAVGASLALSALAGTLLGG